jgi:hypothetical protein
MNRTLRLSEVTIGTCVQLLQEYRRGIVSGEITGYGLGQLDQELADVDTALDELRSERTTPR